MTNRILFRPDSKQGPCPYYARESLKGRSHSQLYPIKYFRSVHTSPDVFEKATVTGHFGFVFASLTRTLKYQDYRNLVGFEKLGFRDGLVRTEGIIAKNNAPGFQFSTV